MISIVRHAITRSIEVKGRDVPVFSTELTDSTLKKP
jgi:hypothetical protein